MYVGLLATLFAVIGWLSSRHIPNAPATSAAQQGTLTLNPLTVARGNLKLARKNPTVFYCIIAISWFWLYGGSFLTQVPNYSVTVLQRASYVDFNITWRLYCWCGYWLPALSSSVKRAGRTWVGADWRVGIKRLCRRSVFTSGLYQTANADLSAVLPLTFIALTDGIHILLDLMFIGMFGGMLVVPLYSMIQQRTEDETRARVLSVNNIINAIFMVVGALLGMLFLSILGWSIPQFFLAVALMNAVFLSAIFALDKIFIERVMAWVSK